MSVAVNLLLLLSALFSALTGASASVRQPPIAQAVAQQRSAAIVAAARRVAARPVQALATLIVSSRAPVRLAPAPGAGEPLFASRRRE